MYTQFNRFIKYRQLLSLLIFSQEMLGNSRIKKNLKLCRSVLSSKVANNVNIFCFPNEVVLGVKSSPQRNRELSYYDKKSSKKIAVRM